MADEIKYEQHHHHETKVEEPCETAVPKVEECAVEASDRGLFDFAGKKEEKKCEEEAIADEFEHKVQVCEPEKKEEYVEEEKKHEGLIQKLHRSGSSSSSVSNKSPSHFLCISVRT